MRKFAFTYFLVVLAVGLATWLVWVVFDQPGAGIDDANIFFVYAKNLADGHGFVYNVGGERVEGFSSLLWTLICTAAFSSSTQPEFVLVIVNILIVSLGITVAISYIQSTVLKQIDSRYAAVLWPLLFLVFLVTSPVYITWNTVTLMENAVWSTLLLLITIFVLRENISVQAINAVFMPLCVLLLLTRPESFLWIGVFTGILLVRKTMTTSIGAALKEMLVPLIMVVVSVIGLTIFRRLYFGYPLPNTYYAKVSPSLSYNIFQGTLYLVKYFVSNPIVSISIVAVVLIGMHTILTLIEKQFMDDDPAFLAAIAGIGLLVPMVTGGDHFSSFRFYQGIYPILLLCLIYALTSVLPRYVQLKLNPNLLRRSQLTFLASLGLLFIVGFASYQVRDWLFSEETSEMSNEFVIAMEGREQGQFVQELFTVLPKLPTLGVVRAGGIKYTYPGDVIDLMGLNNLLMAHNGGERVGKKNHAAFEKSTFYQLKPDLVSLDIVSERAWQYKAMDLKKSWDNVVPLKGLYNDAAFLDLYTYAKVQQKGSPSDKALVGWFQNDFLDSLEASGLFEIESYEYAFVEE